MHLRAGFAKKSTTGPKIGAPTRKQQRETEQQMENARLRQLSKSREWRNRTRSPNRVRRIGDERELSDHLERKTFDSIAVDAMKPKALSANKVLVTVNIESQHQ